MYFQNKNLTNTVRYYLFHSKIIDTSSNRLKDFISKYQEHLSLYIKDYIWHNESFILKPVLKQSGNYIYGQSNYGENIEDEWFIVFLLKELSKFDRHLFIQVEDEDGEFLLIESAFHLEKWAQEPRHTEKRVYIFGGDLHLVSPKFVSRKYYTHSNSFVRDCIDFIEKNPDKTRCNDSIQNCILKRIQDYPDNIKKWFHNAHCYLPIRIVCILHQHPDLISRAVRAFYYRTPDDIKIINSMKHFETDKWIIANVKFTRCLFAQLTSQFIDDSKIKFPLSPNSCDYRVYSNGAKIAGGFEILLCNYEKHKATIDSVNHTSSSLDALSFEQSIDLAGKYVYDYLQTFNPIQTDFIENPLPQRDDESWLNIDSEQLENLLVEKFNSLEPEQKNKNYAKTIPETLMQFFKNQSAGLDGAEPTHSNKIKNNEKQESSNKIDFNEQEFIEFMHKVESLSKNKSDSDSINSSVSSDEDSDVNFGDENIENHTDQDDKKLSQLPEMKAYMMQMDSELSKTILSNSFEKAPLDSDDSDDENVKFNALSNMIKSIEEEINTSQGVGPATTLFAFMNERLPDLREKKIFK